MQKHFKLQYALKNKIQYDIHNAFLLTVEKCRNLSYDYTCIIWKCMVKYINIIQTIFFKKIKKFLKKSQK